MSFPPLQDEVEPFADRNNIQNNTQISNRSAEDTPKTSSLDVAKGKLDTSDSNATALAHPMSYSTHNVDPLSSVTTTSTDNAHPSYLNPQNSPIQKVTPMDSNTTPSSKHDFAKSHPEKVDSIDSSHPTTYNPPSIQSSSPNTHPDRLWHPKPSLTRKSLPPFTIDNGLPSSSNTATKSPHALPGAAGSPGHAQNLVSRGSENSLTEPASATSDAGLFTPKSSPLRPNFRSDTPEPFPTHDTNDWYHRPPKETHSAEVDVDPVSGRKIINDYEIVGELGRGVYGKVKLGRNLQTERQVAIKIIERVSKKRRFGRTNNQEAKIKREIAILKKARHENIVGLLEVIDDPAMKKVYIVLEHVELGEVKWRTSGESEICLVEYRRYLREIDGVTENEAALHEDYHILETARRQIERRENMNHEPPRQNIGPWSLELGQDEEEEAYYPASAHHDENETPNAEEVHDAQQQPIRSGEDTRKDESPHQEPSKTDNYKFKRLSDGLKTDEYHTAIENHALDGTMYGPYDTFPRDEQEIISLDDLDDTVNDEMSRIPEHFRYVPVMTLSEARNAIRDTVLGLEYLHYQGVIHRDIKPANLLETKNHRIKISDFGVSYLGKAVKDQAGDDSESDAQDYDEAIELAKTVGTPAFYAPELCRTDCDEDNPPPVTHQIDVWALGVTLYCFVYGRVPFHDQNPFVLMKNIAEQEAYIPRRRLKAVQEDDDVLEMAPLSATSPTDPSINSNKRLANELDYEEVSDDLYDLLQNLLTKDPRKRIKLGEVKHHAWLLDDIKNPSRWIDESDPSRITQGKKIEVSKEDVESAVRLNVVDNIRNFTKRVIGGVIGLGKSHSRTRAKSTAAVSDTQPSSNASSSSNISQEVKRQEQRRGSLRPDELIFSAIKASRDTDHPLSHSHTASPEVKEISHFHSPHSPTPNHDDLWPSRPNHPERGISMAESVRTIRPSDLAHITVGSGALTTSALPSTPQPLETPTTQLGGIFGGVKNKILMSAANSNPEIKRNRSPSLGRTDPHGEPSVAVSNTTAAGLVNLPALLQDLNAPSSSAASPDSSRATSATGHVDTIRPQSRAEAISRASSLSSVASGGPEALQSQPQQRQGFLPLLMEVGDDPHTSTSLILARSTDDFVDHAKEEYFRRMIVQSRQSQKAAITAQQEEMFNSQDPCPPSPDDLEQTPAESCTHHDTYPHDYHHNPSSAPRLAPSSSEDRFHSEMSQSTSNRSLPSAFSGTSSIGIDYGHPPDGTVKYPPAGEPEAVMHQPTAEHTGYNHHDPNALMLQNVDDDGDDSDDSFIEMSRPKRPDSAPVRGSSVSSKKTGEQPESGSRS
jgi:SNF1-activating kinase 1